MKLLTLAMANAYTNKKASGGTLVFNITDEDLDYVTWAARTQNVACVLPSRIDKEIVQSIITAVSTGKDVMVHFLYNGKEVYAKVISCHNGFITFQFSHFEGESFTGDFYSTTVVLSVDKMFAKAEKVIAQMV